MQWSPHWAAVPVPAPPAAAAAAAAASTHGDGDDDHDDDSNDNDGDDAASPLLLRVRISRRPRAAALVQRLRKQASGRIVGSHRTVVFTPSVAHSRQFVLRRFDQQARPTIVCWRVPLPPLHVFWFPSHEAATRTRTMTPWLVALSRKFIRAALASRPNDCLLTRSVALPPHFCSQHVAGRVCNSTAPRLRSRRRFVRATPEFQAAKTSAAPPPPLPAPQNTPSRLQTLAVVSALQQVSADGWEHPSFKAPLQPSVMKLLS